MVFEFSEWYCYRSFISNDDKPDIPWRVHMDCMPKNKVKIKKKSGKKLLVRTTWKSNEKSQKRTIVRQNCVKNRNHVIQVQFERTQCLRRLFRLPPFRTILNSFNIIKVKNFGKKMCNGCAKINLRERLFKSIFSFKKVRIFTYSSIIMVLEINDGIPRIGMHYSLKGSIDVCCSCFMVLQLRTAGRMVLTKEQSIHLFYFSNKKVHHSRRRRKKPYIYTRARSAHTKERLENKKKLKIMSLR